MEAPFCSKLLKSYDYHNVDLTSFCIPFEVDEETLAESLLFVRKKYARLEPVRVVEKGDFAVLSCKSEKAKFQKDAVSVCVGKNLYSKELEEKLIGLSAGETVEVEVDSTVVTVAVKNIQRSVLPDITDDFVNSTFETLTTVSELKEWYINEQLKEHIKILASQAAEAITAEVIAQSDICLDEEERLAARKSGEEVLRAHWRFNGVELDSLTDEEAAEMFGYPSVSAYINWFADLSERDICTAMLGYELLANGGYVFTTAEYEAELQKNADEANMSAEALRENFTFQAFVRQKSSEYYSEVLEDYAYNYIKERLK